MEVGHFVILGILLGCMATLVPVFMCLFFTAVLGFIFFTDLPLLLLAQTLFRSMDNFALVVVLYFILCGNIMTAGSIVDKLIKVANVLVSWLPGGLGMAGVFGCGLFGAISGSTVATVVALGGFMIPALIENGYRENYTIGLMTTSPNLGVIIPAQHRDDSVLHDQQCFSGRPFSYRVLPGGDDHVRSMPIHLFNPQKTNRFCQDACPFIDGGSENFERGVLVPDAHRHHFRRYFFGRFYSQ